MDTLTAIGLVAATLSMSALAPQVFKTLRMKETRDIS